MNEIYEKLKQLLASEQPVALATVVNGPAYLGAKLLVFPDRTAQGTLGHPTLDANVIADAVPAIWQGEVHTRTYTLDDAPIEVFIEGFPPSPELIIIGAGHISIALTTLAKLLGYRVIVIDARSAFATRARFPHADELIVAWPDEVLSTRQLHPSTSIAFLTHDPKFDEPALQVALASPAGYIGVIGSRRTSAQRLEHLQQQGLPPDQINRIHGPIGLDIGASTPEEIALAIMAEIVAIRHGKTSTPSLSVHT